MGVTKKADLNEPVLRAKLAKGMVESVATAMKMHISVDNAEILTTKTLTLFFAMSVDTANMAVLNSISWQSQVSRLITWKTMMI
jgi:hypothetical protein